MSKNQKKKLKKRLKKQQEKYLQEQEEHEHKDEVPTPSEKCRDLNDEAEGKSEEIVENFKDAGCCDKNVDYCEGDAGCRDKVVNNNGSSGIISYRV